ncbi:uncharacterized protein EKO05_0008353 [Ascochyta rabiei]|uniref:Uncharacterized protein n=1 Tax=Didymella rabiei TaxID=5454 RepID=A0A163DDV7_DIDRA|nr:uncharacterized protein EKO05_0008353 [Ascochyta rabiei]KZM23100.1 hypothetical protein ST47_g5694 [Ascochyta rabiei]UPX18030.1 hypothetical protein EKO05_0008353 [Ascochyta rabiei]
MFSQFKDRVARRSKTYNGQSTPQHNRLSKPRTNTNSNSNSKPASPIVNSDIPCPDSPQYADSSATDRQQIRDSMLWPASKEAESATGPDQDTFDTERVAEGRGRRSTVVSRSNSRAHSRSASALRSFVRSRRNSTANLKNLPDSKVSLASTTQPDIDAAIRLLQEVKRNASPEELAALREALERPTASVAASEQEYDRSSPEISGALTRRKSLVQTPGVATRISPVNGQRRTWNSWKAPDVNPEDEFKWRAPQQGLSPPGRLLALDLADNSRAQTPGELDYSHLGMYKPGSLMVVNGAASPASSTINIQRVAQANKNNDYFSVTESSRSPLAAKNEKKDAHGRSRSAVGLRDSKARSTPDPAGEEKIPITYIKPEIKPRKRPQSVAISTRRSSQSADTLAKDYQAYIPYSPFGNRMVVHNIWQDQEAVTDELFLEDLQSQPHKDLVELSATITDVTELSPPSTATSVNTLETPKHQMLRPSPRTSDSGYSSVSSSGGSSRAFTSEQHPSALRVVVPAFDESPHSKYSADRRQTMSFELPVQGGLLDHTERTLLATVPRHGHGRTLSLDIPREVAELPSMDSVLAPSTPQSVTSKSSEKPLPRQTKRLQKRRPSQPQLPVVQSSQPSREIIPEVPDNVRVKFTRRLSTTPGMECLTHTYPSKDHVNSAEFAADFSLVDSVSIPIQLEPDDTPASPTRSRRRSMSFFRRKSMTGKTADEHEEEIPSPKVLDLGTIAVSLGASPYDPSMFGSFQREAAEHPTHPHQLGQARSRSQSVVSMSSDTAAEYARMRSKDRALPEAEMPEMPQQRKPRRKPKMEIGEAKRSKRRPQTFSFDEVPPMPTIDHSKYPAPLSAKPRLENANVPAANQSRVCANSRPQSPLRHNHTRPPSAHKNVDWEHTVNWEQHAMQWSERRQSIGGILRARPTVEAKENTAPARRPRPMSYTPHELTTFGRFSGGLDYDHDGRGQIGGSAGTRQLHSYAAPKSMHFKQSYGVDRSDVPIFVQRQ